ncbi:MAG: PAS domain S-box protein, partial [Actinobacteria bacterium]|nr:PAS domain S-box protein [Actinomycetota bacterium]
WMYYEVALQRTAPWPSLADVGYLASVPLTLVGLLSFPAAGRLASGRIRLVLDGLITAGALLGGAWPTLIEPVADQVHVGGHLILALAYPVLDLVLVVVAVTVAARSAPRQRRAAAFVVGGIVAVGLADAAFGALVTTGHYGTGAFLDVGWVVGFLLVAAGALTAAARSGGSDGPSERLTVWLTAAPYLPLLGLLAVAGVEQATGAALDGVLVVCGILVGALIVIRQAVISIESTRLADRLRSEAVSHRAAKEALDAGQRLARLGTFEIDFAANAVHWSDELYRILGHEPGAVPSTLPRLLAHFRTEDVTDVSRRLGQAGDGPLSFEYALVHPEGKWVSGSIRRERDGIEPITRVSGILQDVTERRWAQVELLEATEQLLTAQRVAGLGSWDWDVRTQRVRWSEEHYRIFGIEPSAEPADVEFLLGHLHPDDLPAVRSTMERALVTGVFDDVVYRVARPSGDERYVLGQGVVEYDHAGAPRRVVGTALDITDAKRAENELRAADRRFKQGFAQSPVGMVLVGLDGVAMQVNQALCEILARPEDRIVGHTIAEFVHPGDADIVQRGRAEMLASVRGTSQVELRYFRPDGSEVWALVGSSLVRDDAGEPLYFFGQIQDITDRKAAEALVAYEARHDRLTGAANRSALHEALDAAIPEGAALVLLDLDRFNEINDLLGHDVGDIVLVEAAQRLRDTCRPGDTVARIGGDEFAVVLRGIADLDRATRMAKMLLAGLEEAIVVRDVALHVRATLGIVVSDATSDAA